MTWAKHARFMAYLLKRFVACTVASDVERRLLAMAVPDYAPVSVVPNSVEVDPTEYLNRTQGSLIFTGSPRYAPNHDAMTWFVTEVLPQVRARVPDVTLTITGAEGDTPLPTAAGVVMKGHVPDVRACLKSAAVSVAPIRSGGGTRLKIIEAMAVKTPVVATTKAVEGLDVRDGEHLLLADTPLALAEAVVRLLQDPVSARRMADRAWDLCQTRYATHVVVPTFLQLVDLAVAHARSGGPSPVVERRVECSATSC